MSTGPDEATVQLLIKRAARGSEHDTALCEHCDDPLDGERGVGWHVHHRRPRRAGGSRMPDTNRPQNLLAVCAASHREIESYRADAYAHGWLLHADDEPLTAPILLYGGSRWVYLWEDGTVNDLPPHGETEIGWPEDEETA